VTATGQAPVSVDPIERALDRASGVLPDQGPIGVFIHHNTLHAFQHLPFHDAVQAGASALGARPYLSLPEFREALRSGQIDDEDIGTEISIKLGPLSATRVLGGLTRAALWHTLMVTPAEIDDAAGLAYVVRAGTAEQCADRALWDACLARVTTGPSPPLIDDRVFRRHRDVLVALDGPDTDVPVHGELIRLASGFLDHGQAHAEMPGRERGFLRAVADLYASGAAAPRACRGAEADMRDVISHDRSANEIIRSSLEALGVRGHKIEPFLFATALALPGWGGMFSRLERHPDEHPGLPLPRLAEFVAVRLLFERRAVIRGCIELGVSHDWAGLQGQVPPPAGRPAILDAAVLWWLARAAGLPASAVASLDDEALGVLWSECLAFPPLLRRQLFLDASERSYRRTILDAVAVRRAMPGHRPSARPRAQFVFCIDEREESMRRALEEQHPDYITYSVAGFFGVAIDYQGLYDRQPAAHCPVVVTPTHEVYEGPVYTDMQWHNLRTRLRDLWHGWERKAAASSRTLSGGAGMSLLLGPVSGIKTLVQLLAPRWYGVFGDRLTAKVAPWPKTRLSTLRVDPAADRPPGRKPIGFSLEESADRVNAVLRNIGLVRDFAPVVLLLGHGSTSLNNPHESAHDCGACGGRRGGANARLFADLANRPDVREGVRQRGITIPPDTWFVGALHDTADDSVRCFDLESVPMAVAKSFDEAWQALERARRDNALERSRRFHDAPLTQSPADALHHVEVRSTLYAQPRPEYGHCTNSSCFVGRREVLRGLHLDRRAFLVSYDPTLDVGNAILERILAAVGPVGAGISLEYYFSAVDNETFGCGTKLPHNVTGLLGVMNGHESDLRTGLPLQMVELHDAMRLLLIVEATPEALLAVAARQPEVAELVVNAWVQLVSMDPETGALQFFEQGGFVPFEPRRVRLPLVERSPEWHMRSRDHLTPALVRSALPNTPATLNDRRPEPEPVGALNG
jgi:uncharacterized protein YbcC (UPF0753/DUF2309 family)